MSLWFWVSVVLSTTTNNIAFTYDIIDKKTCLFFIPKLKKNLLLYMSD